MGRNVNNKEVTAMITLPMGIIFFGLGVLGLAVVTAIYDTWRLQRKARNTVERQDALSKAA